MKKLEGKVAYITGSGRGIGRAVALKLANDGAKVVVNDLDREPADEVVAAIKAMGGEAIAVTGSVTGDDFAERFINTGIDAMIDVHLKAPWKILKTASTFIRNAAAEEAAEEREVFRKVVNISSVAGTAGISASPTTLQPSQACSA